MEELNEAAQTAGAKFTIKEVKAFEDFKAYAFRASFQGRSFDLMAKLVDQQREGLHKLELPFLPLPTRALVYSHSQPQNTSLSLLKACEEWKIQTLQILFSYSQGDIWTELARSASTGQIGTMKFHIHKGKTERTSKENVKAVWEIAETLEVRVMEGGGGYNPETVIRIGGGRGEDPKTSWEEAFETVLLLYNIC